MRIWLVPSRMTAHQRARLRLVAQNDAAALLVLNRLDKRRWVGLLRLLRICGWIIGGLLFTLGVIAQIYLRQVAFNWGITVGVYGIILAVASGHLHRTSLDVWVLRALHRIAAVRRNPESRVMRYRELVTTPLTHEWSPPEWCATTPLTGVADTKKAATA